MQIDDERFASVLSPQATLAVLHEGEELAKSTSALPSAMHSVAPHAEKFAGTCSKAPTWPRQRSQIEPNDAEVQAHMSTLYRGLEHLFATAMDEGKSDDNITSKTTTSSLAKLLVCTVDGTAVFGKLASGERRKAKHNKMARTLLH